MKAFYAIIDCKGESIMKKCLIVVDYQNDFITGSLGFNKATQIKDYIIRKINEYHADGNQVVFTLDTHYENYLGTVEGKHLPIPHCIKGTSGHEIEEDVKALITKDDILFEKETFGSKELYEYLKKEQYNLVELVGIVSNICVLSNAILAKTAYIETEINILAKGIASNDEKMDENILDVFSQMGMVIIND